MLRTERWLKRSSEGRCRLAQDIYNIEGKQRRKKESSRSLLGFQPYFRVQWSLELEA